MILGLGLPEILIIVVIVLLIFGPKNLPKIGKALGKTVKNVREGMEEGDNDSPAPTKTVKQIDEADVVVVEQNTPAEQAEPVAAHASSEIAHHKFCTSCGARNEESSKFCHSCGSSL